MYAVSGAEHQVSMQAIQSSLQHHQRLEAFWYDNVYQHFSFGFTDAPHWFVWVIAADEIKAWSDQGELNQRRLLEVAEPSINGLSVRIFNRVGDEIGAFDIEEGAGFDARPVAHRNFVIPVDVPLGEELYVVARVTNTDGMRMKMRLWAMAEFQSQEQNTLLLHGIYFGVMLAMFLYNVSLALGLKESAFWFYVLWVPCISIVVISDAGLAFQYFWPWSAAWNDRAIAVFASFGPAFGTIFGYLVLKIRENLSPIWRYIYYANVGLCLLIGTYALFGPPSSALQASLHLNTVTIWVLTISTLIRARQGYSLALPYLLAWAMIMAGGGIRIADTFAYIPRSWYSENLMQIGSALEVLLMSVLVATHMYDERRKRESAQRELLESQLEMNEQLEQSVYERTEALELANEKLEQISRIDGLTGLSNRRYFDEVLKRELNHALRQQLPLSVVMVDVDYFKQINDNFGHAFGDQCLKAIGYLLTTKIKRETDLTARYGGEEFAIILPNTPAEQAMAIAEQIRVSVIDLVLESNEQLINMTCSLGVCCRVPSDVNDDLEILKAADDALYQSKHDGRNRVSIAADLSKIASI
nr:diguanylate cyclase [Echinimonas agarilytica]